MPNEPLDPRWPRLLGLAVHEFRTPITVVAGYIRMLLKERAGPITDQQRKLLEEAEKSCGRLSGLVSEMSDLGGIEEGRAPLKRTTADLREIIAEAIADLAPLPDREVHVELEASGDAAFSADPQRLKTAMASLIAALRREVVTSDRLIVRLVERNGRWVVAIGDADQIEALAASEGPGRPDFDEWRGGSGLTLAVARRIITQHGGSVYGAPGEAKAGALVVLPRD